MSVTVVSISQDLNADIAHTSSGVAIIRWFDKHWKDQIYACFNISKAIHQNHSEVNLQTGETSINLLDEEELLGVLIYSTLKWSGISPQLFPLIG